MTETGKQAIRGRIPVRVDVNTVIFIHPEDDREAKLREFNEDLKTSRTIW